MPVERPTFSESWYRVAELKPRLRGSVQIHRQHFRGQMWHVLQDPANNQFFRLNEAAYRFVALLDGRRTISQTWQLCNEQLGDNAPTQGEAIQLLGQLYSSNLLQAEMAPDAEGLFNRYKKRVSREVRGYMMNLLFIRIPLLDPDRFLNAWVGIIGKLFTWYGFVLWMLLLAVGGYFVVGNYRELSNQFTDLFNQEKLAQNLVLMYVSFALIKTIHEFGHAFACKKFGLQSGSGGEVHVMGLMFLVLTPVPYVDASSSWAFRQKWHRFIVGAAGMIVEMAVAAIAAIVWALTAKDTTIHALAYNAMIIGSVTTLLFNGNPLLRYDGYYMLSDLLEIPNLQQRSKDYIYYLVKKYAWGVKNPRNPAHTPGEKAWFVFYGITSTIYRTIVVIAILWFIASQLFMLGVILAIAASIAWLCVPVVKFIHYLATHGELMRVRSRAVGTVLITAALIVGYISLYNYPDRWRFPGVLDWMQVQVIHTAEDGFVENYRPTQTLVKPGDMLLEMTNPDLTSGLQIAQAELEGYKYQRMAQLGNADAAGQILMTQMCNLWQEIVERLTTRNQNLHVQSPIEGRWVSDKIDRVPGRYLTRQMELGRVVSGRMIAVGAISQDSALPIREAWKKGELTTAQVRVEGRPDLYLEGKIISISEAGTNELPSKALGVNFGGPITTDPQDQQGMRSVEPFFVVKLDFDGEKYRELADRLHAGQRIVIRMELPPKPLWQQWGRSLRQMFQKGFE